MTDGWKLTDAPKRFTLDQDKIKTPADTVENVKQQFEALDIDILDKTIRIDNGRLDIPVFFSVCGADAAALTGTRKQMGKGATPEQAEASAVMELVERFSFYSFADNPDNFITAAHADIADRAMPLEMIARSVNDTTPDADAALEIFAELPMRWTTGHNFTRNQPVMIPFDWFFAINEFNGTSAGNCLEEALCQGICEIVERHVSALVSRDRLRVPGIREASADDAMVKQMLDKYHKNGIHLYVSDFTCGMGIPTVGILAHDPSTFPEKSEIVWTAGTTPDPQKAFSRALTEVAQLAGDFNTGANYVASGLPKFNSMDEAGFVTRPHQIVDISDLPDISDNNIRVEVERCIAALAERGMEVISINTRYPALDASALYTIIPGAHFRERAAAGSVGMFVAKHITQTYSPKAAIAELIGMNQRLPDKYYIQFYLGQTCLAMDDPETAADHFLSALDSNPDIQDVPSIYSYLGVAYKEMEDYRSALDVLKKGATIDSDRTDIYNLMGFCHFKLKNHEAAIDDFKQVVRLNPSSAIDYANIASNYRELGDTQHAIDYYRVALRIDPSIEFARNALQKLEDTVRNA